VSRGEVVRRARSSSRNGAAVSTPRGRRVLLTVTLLVSAIEPGSAPTPGFVIAIFVTLFIGFNVFAVNMVLQYRKIGRWRDYLYGERAYMPFSLIAKSLLAWQVFFGTLRP